MSNGVDVMQAVVVVSFDTTFEIPNTKHQMSTVRSVVCTSSFHFVVRTHFLLVAIGKEEGLSRGSCSWISHSSSITFLLAIVIS